MSRNGSGTYSKVNTFVAGNTITAAGHNQNWDDLVAEVTNSVAADGQTTITGALKGANGTASAPGYGFAADPNTGVYRHGADELGFATGGTAAGYFDSAQKFFMLGAADIAGLLGVTGVATFSSTSHLVLPNGTTGQRPGSPAAAMVRFNSTTGGLEFYNGASWVGITPPAGLPQGRLTLVTGTPVMVSDQSAVSTVYYTPYNGNLIPIYDGASLINNTFSELSMVMSGANFASGGIYDLFVASDSGTLRLAIGPVWGTLTAGSGARGTGAGTTELERKNGIWTNKVSMTARYASGSTFTVAANQGTYVGSLQLDGTNSQVSCLISYGTLRKWGLWNAYNRVPIVMKAGDASGGTENSTTLHPLLNTANNSLSLFTGLPEESFDLSAVLNCNYIGTTEQITTGIGYNSTSAASGFNGIHTLSTNLRANNIANYQALPALGAQTITHLVKCSSTSFTAVGAEAGNVLIAKYRG